MKAILSIPSAYGDAQKDFRSKKGEISDAEFVKEFKKDYDKHKFGVDYMMTTRFRRNMAINSYEKENNNYDKLAYHYNDIDCVILNTNNGQETIDNLIKYYQTGEQFAIVLRLVNLTDKPDIETDVREWYSSTMKIANSNKLTDHEKLANFPQKDLKVMFPTAKSNAILKNCKILTKKKSNEYVLIVEKIIFVVNK